ncbi:hypothetical protein [Sinorhizobium terangae]|uniref:DUF3426 domain-containing protein n=1 Tax=Sinorhizobium terangae TaxID=110322 RepID=A0A6N7LJ37_SINTE|nr:hypothetical protein [Sinorhizobium terangae]MBB4185424.1 hypothetical protein [Sinorhizobium terangae]MQX16865.1 hypothetical protein [Sinorhizobium terangae]WFU46500.1 hypothetical protein QA637_11375 [Sinorhizobium terangae]
MLWLIVLLVAVAIVYLAARYSRFRSQAELILSVAVALGLIVAFVIWLSDRGSQQPPTPEPTRPAGLTTEDVALEGVTFERNQSERSYRVRGTVHNRSAAALEYFRLTVTLEDCPGGACEQIGDDTALILVRVPGGQSRPFETFLTFPFRDGEPPTTPKWTYEVSQVRGAATR